MSEAQAGNVALERDCAPTGRRRSRLLTLEHLDGRTTAIRNVRETEAAIAADLGGTEHLSTAQRALARRAAVLSGVVEDAEARWATGDAGFELDRYLAAVNALRRVLSTLGLERRARPVPHLHDYLQQQAEAKQRQHEAGEAAQ